VKIVSFTPIVVQPIVNDDYIRVVKVYNRYILGMAKNKMKCIIYVYKFATFVVGMIIND